MKKRVAGGVVLVAIGVGIWLSNLFNGIGPGGDGSNVGLSPDVSVSLENASPATGEVSDEPAEGTPMSATERPVVVIDAQEYFLEQRQGETTAYVPVSLEQIVEQAKTATPDADGIRVQIKRRGSSRHSAESALDTSLHNAGITDEQIQRHTGFVE